MAEVDYQKLEERLGRSHLERRLRIQSHHEARLFGYGKVKIHLEHIRTLHRTIRGILRTTGVYRRGRENALAVHVRFNSIACPGLPEAFEGFRILHISDTHMDGNPGLLEKLIQLVQPLEYDLCVFTGDVREGSFQDCDIPARHLTELRRHIQSDLYAVLGNHDAVEMVPVLEAGGIHVLLNEHILIERGQEQIAVAGIDDPHYFETDDLDKALDGIPADCLKILLAHSPEICQKAANSGIKVYLCGHTHAGQICLPNGRPLLTNTKCPPECHSGAWTYQEMTGYTSAGAGTSSVNVRFNCPPEITVHRLTRAMR